MCVCGCDQFWPSDGFRPYTNLRKGDKSDSISCRGKKTERTKDEKKDRWMDGLGGGDAVVEQGHITIDPERHSIKITIDPERHSINKQEK